MGWRRHGVGSFNCCQIVKCFEHVDGSEILKTKPFGMFMKPYEQWDLNSISSNGMKRFQSEMASGGRRKFAEDHHTEGPQTTLLGINIATGNGWLEY